MSKRSGFLLTACVALFPLLASAKPLYVNNASPSCSDSTSYANNDSARPWCTIGRAAWGTTNPNSENASEAARAGDTVYVSTGTYLTASSRTACGNGARFAVALNPANSGTSNAPITFVGVGTVNVALASGYVGPTIGVAGSRNYIVWDNFNIDETTSPGASCPDTGPVVLSGTTGSKILNTTIRGTYRAWGDNYNGIRTEAASGVTVANNTIYGITGNFGHNAAAIMMYDTSNSLFEHNLIHSSTTGIYVKGDHEGDGWPQQNNVFRFNWIENCSDKGFLLTAFTGSRIYQNILKNNGYGFRVYGAGSQSVGVTIANNTIISTASNAGYSNSADTASLTNIRIFNNIFYGPFGEAVNIGDAPGIGDQAFEHNIYFGFAVFGSLNGSQISFATWKNNYGRDNVATAGQVVDPRFADTTSYRLRADSPGAAMGIDILDLNGNGNSADLIPVGAYVTGSEIIGRGGSPGSPPPPPPPSSPLAAPTNLRVI